MRLCDLCTKLPESVGDAYQLRVVEGCTISLATLGKWRYRHGRVVVGCRVIRLPLQRAERYGVAVDWGISCAPFVCAAT